MDINNFTAGTTIASADVNENFSDIAGAINDGWIPADQSWAYASATTITVPSGAASRYSVGDKIKLTQTTVKYFYVVGVADTVLTITGGTDYTLANAAITDNYYSKATSPVGFPGWFAYTPSLSANGSMTYTSTTVNLARFKMDGNMVTLVVNHTGTVGGTPNTTISATLPVNCKNDYTYCANNIFNNGANAVGYSGVATSNQSLNSRIANGGNWTAGAIIIRAEIVYEAG